MGFVNHVSPNYICKYKEAINNKEPIDYSHAKYTALKLLRKLYSNSESHLTFLRGERRAELKGSVEWGDNRIPAAKVMKAELKIMYDEVKSVGFDSIHVSQLCLVLDKIYTQAKYEWSYHLVFLPTIKENKALYLLRSKRMLIYYDNQIEVLENLILKIKKEVNYESD